MKGGLRMLCAAVFLGILPLRGVSGQTIGVLSESGLDSLLLSRGGRPLVVNLWATWCAPCREEFPHLLRAAREFPGVDAVALSVDYPDEIGSRIRPFVKKMKITIPVFVSSIQKQETLIDRLAAAWNGALPATFVFTRSGERDTFYVGRQSLTQFRAAFLRAGSGL